jgi:hypothetical protein
MGRLQVRRARQGRFALLLMLAMPASRAVELGDYVDLHGFGSQDYAQTNHNTYLNADKSGTWNINFLGLVGAVTLSDKLKLWAQLEASNQDATRFTWAFLDYSASDALSVQIGRIKLPSGLYNETIDTKFLQLSSLAPLIYQDASDFVHDSYTGTGLRYEKAIGGGRLTWQLYAGESFDPNNSPSLKDGALVGTRMTYGAPLEGLRFMASFNRGDVKFLLTGKILPEERTILSVDYSARAWDVKAEYAIHHFNEISSNGYYVQVGRTLARWTPFVRYDTVNLNRSLLNADSFTQKSVVAGLGFELRSTVSLRGEAHFNHGYALPVASGEVIENLGTPNWMMIVFGVHFIF